MGWRTVMVASAVVTAARRRGDLARRARRPRPSAATSRTSRTARAARSGGSVWARPARRARATATPGSCSPSPAPSPGSSSCSRGCGACRSSRRTTASRRAEAALALLRCCSISWSVASIAYGPISQRMGGRKAAVHRGARRDDGALGRWSSGCRGWSRAGARGAARRARRRGRRLHPQFRLRQGERAGAAGGHRLGHRQHGRDDGRAW